MRSVIAVFALAAVMFFPVNAYAACPNITGPHSCCGGGFQWHTYAFDTTCAGTSGSVSGATLSCFSSPSFAITGSTGTITYSYTIQAGDPIINSNHWSVSLFVDFDDNGSQFNTLTASVGVTHNGSTTSNTIFTHNGTQGDLSCVRKDYSYFSAVAGDTITVTITGTNFSATTIEAAAPTLFNET